MGNKEQRIYVKLTTSEAAFLTKKLCRAVYEARDHGENQIVMDEVRNIEFKVIPTIDERSSVLEALGKDHE